ncbi:BTAD domain-containing putative transcriptional regulator [Nocardia sp. NPDC051833]|uniref:BTAD domain-containing putative transcriptional regulator n=1 Tax=Nocardia sp. NPDC051833 TaxID=3155674 RepID=UPI00342018AC
MVFLRALGAIEVEVDGHVVDLGGPVPRRFLAALSTGAGSPLSDAALADLVWGAEQPRQASATLRVVASRLRSALGPAGRELVRRRGSGYLLALPAERTDLGRFADLVAAGVREFAVDDPVSAERVLSEALALWRGDPWPELEQADGPLAERIRLRELYEVAIEERAAARLACGELATVVADLGEAVTAAPFRERRWELLASALYRSGRQAQALAELRRVRELLVAELGVEPGPALRSLERRMLEQDPGLLVESPGARPDSPPGRRPPHRRPLSTFLGRDDELRVLGELLTTERLVSVVGPAGVGKTRLAIEHWTAAEAPVDRWFVRLGDVDDGDAVPTAIATTLSLVQRTGDPVTQICRALAATPGLLVLDNCEHLVEPVARVVVTVLAACPHLRILATSRQPLGVDGEHVLALSPLPVFDELGDDGAAVRLLFDRVRAGRAGWRPDAADRTAAHEICAMLDGLPLAIELAAARERAFGLPEIATHLRDRRDVLGPTPHGSLSRHADLSAAIGWSVDDLASGDRALLVRLWPFEGGFTWQAAAATYPDAGVLAPLASLVDRSVLALEHTPSGTRYRLLETVRGYCRGVDPAPGTSRAEHARWVRTFAAEKSALLTGHHAAGAYRSLAAELPNLRAGIAYDLEHHPVAALRTVAALQFAWSVLGIVVVGRTLLRDALAAAADAPAADRAFGLLGLSIVSFHAGEPAEALAGADAAMAILGGPETERELWLSALMYRALAWTALGDPATARVAVDALVAEVDRLPTPEWIRGCAEFGTGTVLLLEGRRTEAVRLLRVARERSADCGHLWCEGMADVVLAWAILADPDDTDGAAAALTALDRALGVFARQSNIADALGAVYAASYALMARGRPEQALRVRAAALHHSARVGADPRRYAQFAHPAIVARMDRLLAAHSRPEELSDGAAMSWPAVIDLVGALARADRPELGPGTPSL